MAYADEEFLGPLPADNDHDGWARRTRRAYELEWEDRSVLGQRYRAAKAACYAETQRSLAAGLAKAREEHAARAEQAARVARPVEQGPVTAPWLPPQGDQRLADWAAYHHGLAYRAFTSRPDYQAKRGPDGCMPQPRPLFVPDWLDLFYRRTTLYDLFLLGREGRRWGPASMWAPRCAYEVNGVAVAGGDTPEQAAAMFRWFQQGGHLGGGGR